MSEHILAEEHQRHRISTERNVNMETQIVECKKYPGEWLVESINHASEGECYVARFSGPSAEPRARQYAAGLCDHCVGTRYESEERECEFCT